MADPKADPTELVRRWLDDIEPDDIAVVDVPSATDALTLAHSTHKAIRFVCRDYAVYRAVDAAGLLAVFGAEFPEDVSEAAIVYLPKGKERLKMTMEMIAAWLRGPAPLWLVGPKRGGIGSARAIVEEVATVDGIESGKHSKLLRAHISEHPKVSLFDYAERWVLERGGRAMHVVSFPGVFGHGRLDDGTALLLDTVPATGFPLLDVGCGAGIIGTWYAARGESITLVDADAFALEAARRTAASNGLLRLDVRPADVFPQCELSLQEIISNPPFHRGFETDHTVSQRLVSGAKERLRPGGRLTIVANRFLQIPDLLDATFGSFAVLGEDSRYKVYQATRAR